MSNRIPDLESLNAMLERGGSRVAGNPLSSKQEKNSPSLPSRKREATQSVESKPKRDYKAELLQQLALVKIPVPVAEFRFHPTRKWRFDFVWTVQKIAVEFDGGIFSRQASHSSIAGILRDQEKMNEAAIMGWIVIRVNPKTIESGKALAWIERALYGREEFICAKCGFRQDPAKRTGEPEF